MLKSRFGLWVQDVPGLPNGPLMEPSWSLIVGICGIVEDTWGSRWGLGFRAHGLDRPFLLH